MTQKEAEAMSVVELKALLCDQMEMRDGIIGNINSLRMIINKKIEEEQKLKEKNSKKN